MRWTPQPTEPPATARAEPLHPPNLERLPPLTQILNLQRMPTTAASMPAPPMVVGHTAPGKGAPAHQTTLRTAAVEKVDVHVAGEAEIRVVGQGGVYVAPIAPEPGEAPGTAHAYNHPHA
eukprot:8031038-Alexandrium_andersonii.AAC.1